jgi:VIT1/CCC1 family predicted Fe2+/Mn2+ transporter
MGLIVGLDAATASRATIVSGLLIVGLADNITDSLSIHIYQEAERLEGKSAFRATVTNFLARLLVTLSFVVWMLFLPPASLGTVSLAWGLTLLGLLTFLLARARKVPVGSEIAKHVAVAVTVIVVSRAVGGWIAAHVQ